jgi:hypothetical protein
MLDKLRCADFAPAVGEVFTVALEGLDPLPLTLASATEKGAPGSAELRQPFTLVFLGPASDHYLRQGTYRLQHERLGALDLFVVPVGPQAGRMQYEAIFA